jgi:hypothetical protein
MFEIETSEDEAPLLNFFGRELEQLILKHQDGEQSVSYDGRRMTFTGAWNSGPIQKVIVTLLALRLEEHGLHPFHASAVRYRDRTILFMGGESNHGKSMGQIEACRRGAKLVSTETTVIDESGTVILGSKAHFLKKRDAGTERADKAAPEAGVDKFFGDFQALKTETVDFVELAPGAHGRQPLACDGGQAEQIRVMGATSYLLSLLHARVALGPGSDGR